MRDQKITLIINPKPHFLKAEIRKRKLRLWQVRNLLGGTPHESQLSRYLNGVDPMPESIQESLAETLKAMGCRFE